jgi:hypothetical protein
MFPVNGKGTASISWRRSPIVASPSCYTAAAVGMHPLEYPRHAVQETGRFAQWVEPNEWLTAVICLAAAKALSITLKRIKVS